MENLRQVFLPTLKNLTKRQNNSLIYLVQLLHIYFSEKIRVMHNDYTRSCARFFVFDKTARTRDYSWRRQRDYVSKVLIHPSRNWIRKDPEQARATMRFKLDLSTQNARILSALKEKSTLPICVADNSGDSIVCTSQKSILCGAWSTLEIEKKHDK